jgi:cytochrome c
VIKKALSLSALAMTSMVSFAPAALAGDAAAGEGLWGSCRSCHSIANGDATIQRGGRTGPNLYGLPGRVVGSIEGFRYSPAMQAINATGLTWTEELFVEYMADPTAWVRAHGGGDSARSAMSFRMANGAADMWAYLESVSQ